MGKLFRLKLLLPIVFLIAVGLFSYALLYQPGGTKIRNGLLKSLPVPLRGTGDKQAEESEKAKKRAADRRRLESVKKEIQAYVADRPGKVSFYLQLNETSTEMDGADQMASASLIKLPIAVAVYREAIDGHLKLSEKLRMPEVDPSYGGQVAPPGSEVEIDKLLEYMLSLSDNASANAVIDRLGMDKIVRSAKAAGAGNTVLKRKMLDAEAIAAGRENLTTARDMTILLDKIRRRAILTPAYCEAILSKMRLNTDKEMLASLSDVKVTHKVGVIGLPSGFVVGDAGIVERGGKSIALAIMTNKQPSEGEGIKTVEAIARIAAKALDSQDLEPSKPNSSKKSSSARLEPKTKQKWKVCIDPGHQLNADLGSEPVGPGSGDYKAKVTGGATGAATGIPEYKFALELSKKIAAALEKKGVQVVMTRERDDVSLTNIQRAEIANKAGACLFLRVHADSSTDSSVKGFSVLYPSENAWTKPIYASSIKAAKALDQALAREKTTQDRGLSPRGDLSGFNWAKVPSVLLEAGFLSNPEEDQRLNSGDYQKKLATSIADGVLSFLKE